MHSRWTLFRNAGRFALLAALLSWARPAVAAKIACDVKSVLLALARLGIEVPSTRFRISDRADARSSRRVTNRTGTTRISAPATLSSRMSLS